MTEQSNEKKPRRPRRDSRYILIRIENGLPTAEGQPAFAPELAHDQATRFKTPKQAWAWAEENQARGMLALACIREVRDCNVRQLWLGKKVVV